MALAPGNFASVSRPSILENSTVSIKIGVRFDSLQGDGRDGPSNLAPEQTKRLANLFEISVDANDQTLRVEGDVEPPDLMAEISFKIDPGTGSILAENLD